MTIADDEALFVDTNILIYATDPRSPFHVVASRPVAAGGGTPIADVLDNVESFRAAFRVVEDGPEVVDQLVSLIRQIPTAGRRVHDTNLVATMLAHGVRRLLTHNTDDFARYTHLITVVPLVPPAPGHSG